MYFKPLIARRTFVTHPDGFAALLNPEFGRMPASRQKMAPQAVRKLLDKQGKNYLISSPKTAY